PKTWSTASNEPQKVEPSRPLPSASKDGVPAGYEGGWQATTHPIEISSNLDVDVKPNASSGFFLEPGDIDMAQITGKAPPGSLYVVAGSGFLAIRTAV